MSRSREDCLRVPSAPVAQLMSQGGRTTVSLTKNLQRLYHHGQHDGYYTLRGADRLCVAMGMHPAEVYGPTWWEIGSDGS
jgi:hypothetical protein